MDVDRSREPTNAIVICVVIVSGSRLYRDCLAAALARESTIRVIGRVGQWESGMESIREFSPAVMLVDHAAQDHIAVIPQFRRDDSAWALVALGRYVTQSEAAIHLAGIEYVSADASLNDLIEAVRRAAGLAASPIRWASEQPQETTAEPSPGNLTRRETQVLRLVDQGFSNKEIARLLCIEVATVKNHVHSVLQKLHLHRRTQVAAWLRSQDARSRNSVPSAADPDRSRQTKR